MITLSSTQRDIHYIKCTVYGQAGVGKTVLCSTAPKPLILSAEAGLLSLAGKDIPCIEITNLADLKDAYKFIVDNEQAYQTICLDSISDIAEQVLDNKLAELTKKADEKGKEIDPRQGYGKMAMEMMQLTRAFRSLNAHIVFTAKQGYVQDNSALKFGPMLPGQMYTQNFPYLMDIVMCMRATKEGTRYLQTQPDLQYLAKDRSGKLDKAEQPNLTEIFNKVLTHGKAKL